VYRPLHFVRHLSARGYPVTVLTGKLSPDDPQDPTLLLRVPSSVRVLRVRHLDPFRGYQRLKRLFSRDCTTPRSAAPPGGSPSLAPPTWKDYLSESLQIPDRWRSWILPATLRAVHALRLHPPDVLFSTSPPHSMHLVAGHLSSLLQRPMIIDFRDPWVDNPFRGDSHRFVEVAQRRLERQVVEAAQRVILNTPAIERRFRERYPDLAHFLTITNGFDSDSTSTMAVSGGDDRPPDSGEGRPGARLSIVHVGHLYGMRSGRYLLAGLELLRQRSPATFAAVEVRLVGRMEDASRFQELVDQRKLTDVLSIEGPCAHAVALERQRRADVLLILGVESEGPEIQVPSKLYEYFAAARPVLTLSRKGGAIEEILRVAEYPYEQADPDDSAQIAAAFERLVRRRGETAGRSVDPGNLIRFRYDRLTDQLEECLNAACAAPWT